MQVPILNGVYTDSNFEYRTSYPINMIPVALDNGISKGYLKPADGIVSFGTGAGVDRGGINWNGEYYRVMGSKLQQISSTGVNTTIGDVGGDGDYVRLTYSADRLAIMSADNLYYYNTVIGLIQVTDADLGDVHDLVWVDGYFMTTDGSYLVVTDLADPTSVNPLKYGSAEASPDPIVALLKLRNEVYALNRYTIEVFSNVGGSLFPFARAESAQVGRGCIGTFACTVFMESIVFVGGGEKEGISVWMAQNGSSVKIATREIDQILEEHTEYELSTILVESRVDKNHEFLYIHLPNKTIVFDGKSTSQLGQPVWFILTSDINMDGIYNARNFVYCYDKWLCGNTVSSTHGYLTDSVMTHYGEPVGWEFGTTILYNNNMGAIVHSLELIGIPGSAAIGVTPSISTKYSYDGIIWSGDKSITIGTQGNRTKRMVWFQQGHMTHTRIQKFIGNSDSNISISRLEANIEPLNA